MIRTASFLLFALVVVSSCSPHRPAAPEPEIENGVLDLSSWDFDENGPLALHGEWKFKWLESSPAFAASDFDDATWKTFRVPGYWDAVTDTSFGYCWLRATVTNVRGNGLGLYLFTTHTSYKLYVDGKMVMSNGKPGTSREETVSERVPSLAPLPDAGRFTVAWKIANFDEVYGGPGQAPVLGKLPRLTGDVWREKAADMFVIGIILIVFFYHLVLWFLRKEDAMSLYFAAFCLTLLVRTVVSRYHFLDIVPALRIHEVHAKLEVLTFPAAWFFIRSFLRKLFPEEFFRKPDVFFVAASIVFALITLVTPSRIYKVAVIGYEAIVVAGSIFLVATVVRALLKKRKGSLIMTIGFGCLFAGLVNDLVYSNMPGVTVMSIQFSLVLFIVMQSIALAVRFSDAYRTAEYLSRNLQEEVGHKTRTISEQNDELARLDRERTAYFINLAHEIKTPLTLIRNYLAGYFEKKGEDDESRIIRSNVEKLSGDIGNFLDHEKLVRGQVFYDHGLVIDASGSLETTAAVFCESARMKGIEFETDIEPGLCVRMDPSAFDRIAYNLLDNAIKYTDEGGRITLGLSGSDGHVSLVVTDTGIGIPVDEQKHIFDSYYQISHEKRNIQGIGMGLCIVKRIVDDANGSIALDSESGRGTTFTLVFARHVPLATDTVVTRPALGVSSHRTATRRKIVPHAFDASKRNVLVVEDNPDMLAHLCESLSARFNVFCARNGREALDLLRGVPVPQLIVSDIMMDVMDGYEFCELLGKDSRYDGVPFVFLTAKSSRDDKLDGLSRGAVDYICKPFDIEELVAKINANIAVREAHSGSVQTEIEERIIKAIRTVPTEEPAFSRFEHACDRYGLTSRESEILVMTLRGKDAKEIAFDLDISYPTVRTHLLHLFEKVGVRNKVELVNAFRDAHP